MPIHQPQFSVLTFNLLAPCYKRLFSASGQERSDRERDHAHLWNARLDQILHLLDSISPAPDIIALQEVWFHPPFLARLERAFIKEFHVFIAQRPHPKADGLATLIRRNHPHLSQPTLHSSFPLADTDRIALAIHLSISPSNSEDLNTTLLVVNTHLTFPHNQFLRRVRDTQAHALTSFVSSFVSSSPGPVSTLALGDFNSDMHSVVCTRMLDANFRNCYTALNGHTAHPTTHYNHERQHVFVDHVFLRSDTMQPPIFSLEPSTTSHNSSVTPKSLSSPSPSLCSPITSPCLDSSPRSKSSSSRSRSSSPSTVGLPDVFELQAPKSTSPQSCESSQSLQFCEPFAHIKPIASAVYPEDVPNEFWPPAFQISDHRPVGISFSIGSDTGLRKSLQSCLNTDTDR